MFARPRSVAGVLAMCIACSILFAGCMTGASSGFAPSGDEAARGSVSPAASSEIGVFDARSASVTAAGEAPDLGKDSVGPMPVSGEAPAVEPHAERMRVFSADMELSVVSVEQTRDEIIAFVARVDGYIESSWADILIVRVPAATFESAMERLERFGDLLARSVETADVTEQYVDLERRLDIARAARERLYELLRQTDAAEEQVAILREIRRLSEEVEQLSSQLEALGLLVTYSRITIRLSPRLAPVDLPHGRIPFPWIAALDPLNPTVGRARRRFEGEIPPDFARFSEGREVRAESADGVRLRLGARDNEPRGDARFWREALAFHLAPAYERTERIEAGDFLGVAFESRDPEPYTYWVLVRIENEELIVAECFFPTEELLAAHRARLMAYLGETAS